MMRKLILFYALLGAVVRVVPAQAGEVKHVRIGAVESISADANLTRNRGQKGYRIIFTEKASQDLWNAMNTAQGRVMQFGTPYLPSQSTSRPYQIDWLSLMCHADPVAWNGEEVVWENHRCYLYIDTRRSAGALTPDAKGFVEVVLTGGDAQYLLDFWDFEGEERNLHLESSDGRVVIQAREPENAPATASASIRVKVQ